MTKTASTIADASLETAALIRAGLDTLSFGFAIFDRNLKLVASNKAFRTLRGYPVALCRPGTELLAFYRFNAERGDNGRGELKRVIRQEQDGLLLIIDKNKLTGQARADAIKLLQDTLGRLAG